MAGTITGKRCELMGGGHVARSVMTAMRERFDVASTHSAHRTVLTVGDADQAAVRALMLMLWDSGHEVLAMST